MTIVAPPNPESRKIAQWITEHEKRIARVESGLRTAQLGNSSMHGSGVQMFDANGNYRGTIGFQEDGTTTVTSVNPQPPPVMGAPIVVPGLAHLNVIHNGETATGESLPKDFSHLNIYTADVGLPEVRTFRGTINTIPGEFPVTGLDYTQYLVTVTAVNLGGKESEHSVPSSGTPVQAVSTDLIDGIIQEIHLNANIVGEATLKANAVTATKITDDAIETRHLTAGSVDTAALAANSVNAGKIAAGSITTEKIAALAVTANELAANSVTAGKIAAGSVTAAKLEANLILATRIIAGTSTGNRVEIHPTLGLQGFANNGATRTFWIDAATGNVSIVGTLSTSVGGDRMIFGTEAGRPTIFIYDTSVYDPNDFAFINAPLYADRGSSTGGFGLGIGINSGTYYDANAAIDIRTALVCTPNEGFFYVMKTSNGVAYGGIVQVGINNAVVGCTSPTGNYQSRTTYVGPDMSLISNRIRIFSNNVLQADMTSAFECQPSFVIQGAAGLDSSARFGADSSTTRIRFQFRNGNIDFVRDDINAIMKTFVIPHPSPEKKSTHYLAHATTESPHGGVEYWGVAEIEDGYPVRVTLPDYFEDLTQEEGRVVLLTVMNPSLNRRRPKRKTVSDRELMRMTPTTKYIPANAPDTGIPQVAATYPENGEFEIQVDGTCPETMEVMWLVKAIRKDVPPLVVEPSRDSVTVHGGNSPYTWMEFK